jgi:hypothetical protein
MEYREALSILRLLADGIDPNTNQPFATTATYNSPRVIRALEAAVRATEWADRKTSLPENVGKGWTPEEDQRLRSEFHSSADFSEIARRHGRTRGAILTRLERLGEMPAPHPIAEKANG